MNVKPESYGEHLETTIIVVMSAFIIFSIAWVFWLNGKYAPDCRAMDYTYCGEPAHHAPEH